MTALLRVRIGAGSLWLPLVRVEAGLMTAENTALPRRRPFASEDTVLRDEIEAWVNKGGAGDDVGQ